MASCRSRLGELQIERYAPLLLMKTSPSGVFIQRTSPRPARWQLAVTSGPEQSPGHPAMTDIGTGNQEQLVIPSAERIGVGDPTRPRKRSDPPRHQWR